MKIILQMLLCIFIISMLGACTGEQKKQNEPKAKTDHLYKPQFDALEKAKKTEKMVQDVYKEKLKSTEE